MMEFGKHEVLAPIYTGYQGCPPQEAKLIFIGRDANFEKDLDPTTPYFKELQLYFANGKEYVLTRPYHHPALNNDEYDGEIEFFHGQVQFMLASKEVSKRKEILSKCCFMDLVGVPTFGKGTANRLEYLQLLRSEENKVHLQQLNELFTHTNKAFFMSLGSYSLAKEQKLFTNLPTIPVKPDQWYTNRKPDAGGSRIPRFGNLKNYYLITSFGITVTSDELGEVAKFMNLELVRTNENKVRLLTSFGK